MGDYPTIENFNNADFVTKISSGIKVLFTGTATIAVLNIQNA